jgi:ornithine cyclodeaminase/alanine dehydrogenase-like protein (mu-crystallin family)
VAGGFLDPEQVHGELGDVLTGKVSGREGDELIVCDLTGVGAQDAAIAGVTWGLLGRNEDSSGRS